MHEVCSHDVVCPRLHSSSASTETQCWDESGAEDAVRGEGLVGGKGSEVDEGMGRRRVGWLCWHIQCSNQHQSYFYSEECYKVCYLLRKEWMEFRT